MSSVEHYANSLPARARADFLGLPESQQRAISGIARKHADRSGRSFLEVACQPPMKDYLRKRRR